jgi:diguanylate cyclase
MPATDVSQGLAALSRIRQAMLQTSFDDIAPGMTVTFSAGVSGCIGEPDLEAAVARADAAMYQAKRAGRDRALAFEEGAAG